MSPQRAASPLIETVRAVVSRIIKLLKIESIKEITTHPRWNWNTKIISHFHYSSTLGRSIQCYICDQVNQCLFVQSGGNRGIVPFLALPLVRRKPHAMHHFMSMLCCTMWIACPRPFLVCLVVAFLFVCGCGYMPAVRLCPFRFVVALLSILPPTLKLSSKTRTGVRTRHPRVLQ